MSSDPHQLEAAISALEAQRAVLGDAVVDASVRSLRATIATVEASSSSTAEPAPVLKQVSVLFLDVVGSTRLAQRLDPEGMSAVMDHALERGSAIVRMHGGKVLQYAGDNILAAFGADEAKEDGPERAVGCGLSLLELGKRLGAEIQSAHGQSGINVRVGVHTGDVLLGGGIEVDGTIRGIAVHIAARMEQTAPAGRLRISHDTYAHVRGLFEVEVQAPLLVKGVDEPVQSYLVVRAKPRSFRIGTRGIEGVATRMIGRDAELKALQVAFRRLFAKPMLAMVTVVADAGIGKSRLLYEFESWSETCPESFYLFRGRANPQTQGQPFGLLRDILAWRLQIADDDSVEAARAKMEHGVVPLFLQDNEADLAEGHAHLLGHLIGIEWRDSRHIRSILEDPRQIRSRALHAAAQMFRRINASDGRPIVMLLENLHWADNETLDFLSYLSEVNCDVPMLILATSRPTLLERRIDWPVAKAEQHNRIDLGPLDKSSSHELANELLKKLTEIPAALRELVTGGAEGNPFYMEELVKMLIDQGAIDTSANKAELWTLHAERLAAKVPSTLAGVLQARLDGLPPQEKLALQQASVIGHVFWDQALFAIDSQTKGVLPSLVSREVVVPRADTIQDVGGDELHEYAFHHHLLHQVTYDTVLKRHKRELHAKVAQWLTNLSGLRASNFLGATADHYERAGESASAAEFHARAAERAGERLAHDAALLHVGKALALLEQPSVANDIVNPLRWRLLCVREQTLDLQARRAEQGTDIEELERLAEIFDDDRRRTYAARRRGSRAMRMADWPAQEKAARRSMAFAIGADDHAMRLSSLRLLAMALANQGALATGRSLAEQGLAESRDRGLRTNEALLLNTLGNIARRQDDVMGALEFDRQHLLVAREIGDRRHEANALSNLGLTWLELGDLPQATLDLEEALRMLRLNGDRVVEGNSLIHLSKLALWRGENARARELACSALNIMVATQARDMEVLALLRLGEAELALGWCAAAWLTFQQMRARARDIDHPWQHDATAGLARVALGQGDGIAALREAESLLAHVAGGGTFDAAEIPRLIELTCHRVLAGVGASGDSRADEWLARARTALHAQASAISNVALREGFLHNIPHHREIVAAWATRPIRSQDRDKDHA